MHPAGISGDLWIIRMQDLVFMEANVVGIGYEGLDLDALVSRLRLRGVSSVVDVRLNPISRKRGLSKTALRERLARDGIEYEHMPALGNPRDNRGGFSEVEGVEAHEARQKFCELLGTTAAHQALDRVLELAETGAVAQIRVTRLTILSGRVPLLCIRQIH